MSFLCHKSLIEWDLLGGSQWTATESSEWAQFPPWRKILKLLLIQRVVCTALWYKPLSHLYHGIKIGGATPVCFLTGGAFRKSAAVAFRFAYQRFLCQCVILMLYSFLDFWLGQLRWLQKVPFPQTKLPSFSPSTNTTIWSGDFGQLCCLPFSAINFAE